MRLRVAILGILMAACAGAGAPAPSREITATIDPNEDARWEWAQGETVYLYLTARIGTPSVSVRDLSGATCYGVLYSGTSTWFYTTGTVVTATSGVFSVTVTNSLTRVPSTNDYYFACYATGPTSSAFLGRAALDVLYSPDASIPLTEPQDQLSGAYFTATSTNLWEDLRFPAQSLNPAGATDGADLVSTWGPASNMVAAAFEDAKTDVTFAQAQIPHDWYSTGSYVSAHTHVSPHTVTTGHVVLACIYSQAGIGRSFHAPITTLMTNAIYATNRWQHLMWTWPAISLTNATTVSSMVPIRIERRATDAADTYAETLHLLEFDVHYQSKMAPDEYQP